MTPPGRCSCISALYRQHEQGVILDLVAGEGALGLEDFISAEQGVLAILFDEPEDAANVQNDLLDFRTNRIFRPFGGVFGFRHTPKPTRCLHAKADDAHVFRGFLLSYSMYFLIVHRVSFVSGDSST